MSLLGNRPPKIIYDEGLIKKNNLTVSSSPKMSILKYLSRSGEPKVSSHDLTGIHSHVSSNSQKKIWNSGPYN